MLGYGYGDGDHDVRPSRSQVAASSAARVGQQRGRSGRPVVSEAPVAASLGELDGREDDRSRRWFCDPNPIGTELCGYGPVEGSDSHIPFSTRSSLFLLKRAKERPGTERYVAAWQPPTKDGLNHVSEDPCGEPTRRSQPPLRAPRSRRVLRPRPSEQFTARTLCGGLVSGLALHARRPDGRPGPWPRAACRDPPDDRSLGAGSRKPPWRAHKPARDVPRPRR